MVIKSDAHLDVAHGRIFGMIGPDQDVDVLHDVLQVLVEIFRFHAQLQQGAVHFINHQNRFDSLIQSLSHDSLGLDGHT